MLGSRTAAALGLALALVAVLAPPSAADPVAPVAPAQEPFTSQDVRVPAGDGVELLVKVAGAGPLVDGHLPPRPLIVEFTPYGQACCAALAGPAYNYLMVHIRGTGGSDGAFDALGPRTQQDVVDILGWACAQPFSTGRIGLYGFSASAITVYSSLHHELPCVDTAVLGAGTHELYRDLMYPGGIPNQLPALGVFALIGAPSLAAGPDRLGRAPLTALDTFSGMFDTGIAYLEHPTLDGWWQERGMRGDVNDLPVLMVTGFYDVESRGPFQAFQELRDDGAHLYVVGAHDGVPAGSGGSDAVRARWYDRHLRDVPTGVEDEPRVQLWLSNGDREDMLAGDFTTLTGDDWPLPGTTWTSLWLDAARSGSASSTNDGTLSAAPSPASTLQPYVPLPSLPTATDPHTTSLLGVFNGSPELTDMTLVEPLGLSYTTAPLESDVVAVGPASLELLVTSSSPETDLYAVVSDVSPDGVAHPVATGRLRTAYPDIVQERSLVDANGDVVQPYGDFSAKRPPAMGEEQRYHVELWPIGNRFEAGHRLRLHVVGASAFHTPSVPGANLVRVGGPDGSRLLLPVAPADAQSAIVHAADAADGVPASGADVSSVAAGSSAAPVIAGEVARSLPATGGAAAPLVTVPLLLVAALVARRLQHASRT